MNRRNFMKSVLGVAAAVVVPAVAAAPQRFTTRVGLPQSVLVRLPETPLPQ